MPSSEHPVFRTFARRGHDGAQRNFGKTVEAFFALATSHPPFDVLMALNRPAGASVAEELSILHAHVSIHSSATDMQFSATQGARRVHHSRPAQLLALSPMPP